MRRFLVTGGALAVALATIATAANAFTIRGTIKNGTTGATDVSARVVAIEPSAGMREAASAEAQGGKFVLENLPDDSPFFLLRTQYDGVNYNTPVQPTGGDQTVEVEVFESTSSWDGIQITMPHLATARQGNALHIEQLFEITNETSPAKTLSGKTGPFKLHLPTDMDSLTECFVSAGEMPLKVTPIPTDSPDIFTIDYPLRPGITRIGVSFAVPYASGSYSMKVRFPQPVSLITVFAVDSSMHVASTSHELGSGQSVHGMSAYAVGDIPANGEVALTFTGGNPKFAGLDVEGDEHAATPENIRGEPAEDFKVSIFLMITVLLVMAGIVTMALRDRHDPLSDPQVLREHYDLLVSRLAKLDDLHAANTIPSDAYRASREELVGRLAALAMQLRSRGGVHPPDTSAQAGTRSSAQ